MQFDSSKLILRPYLPGRRGFETLSHLWDKMAEEDKLDYFCAVQDPATWGPEQWEKKLQRLNTTLILVFYRPESLLGFVQIEEIRPKRAQAHWMMFGKPDRLRIHAGRETVRRILKVLELDVIYGFTPIVFEGAMKFIKLIGGEYVGTLPEGSYIERFNRSFDSAIFAFSKGG